MAPFCFEKTAFAGRFVRSGIPPVEAGMLPADHAIGGVSHGGI